MRKLFTTLIVAATLTAGCAYINPADTVSYAVKDGALKTQILNQWPDATDITMDEASDNADIVRWYVKGVRCAGMVNNTFRGTQPDYFIAQPYCPT